jgi:hypothetical protein
MSIPKRQLSLILLAAVPAALVGAAGGVSLAEARTANAPATVQALPTWAYLCVEGRSSREVMEKANYAGAQGWELVAAAPGEDASVWCFRQARWARPEPTPAR